MFLLFWASLNLEIGAKIRMCLWLIALKAFNMTIHCLSYHLWKSSRRLLENGSQFSDVLYVQDDSYFRLLNWAILGNFEYSLMCLLKSWSHTNKFQYGGQIFPSLQNSLLSLWRKLHNDKLHSLYNSPNTTKAITAKRMGQKYNM